MQYNTVAGITIVSLLSFGLGAIVNFLSSQKIIKRIQSEKQMAQVIADKMVDDIAECSIAEAKAKASLQEKEILLKEVYHRVKNNFQIIASLLDLQSSYIQTKQDREIFQVCQQRIEAMVLLQEQLYKSNDLRRINLANYIEELVEYLLHAYDFHISGIVLTLNLEPVFINLSLAIPCGLIINELVCNTIKHAFPAGHRGELHITLALESDNKIMLYVSDNGIGIPKDFDFKNAKSLGMQLVFALVDQIGGTIENNSSSGTKFQIVFPMLQ